MKLNRGLPVWQKPKHIFSQIIGSWWKEHNNRSDTKQRITSWPYRTKLYHEKAIVWKCEMCMYALSYVTELKNTLEHHWKYLQHYAFFFGLARWFFFFIKTTLNIIEGRKLWYFGHIFRKHGSNWEWHLARFAKNVSRPSMDRAPTASTDSNKKHRCHISCI